MTDKKHPEVPGPDMPGEYLYSIVLEDQPFVTLRFSADRVERFPDAQDGKGVLELYVGSEVVGAFSNWASFARSDTIASPLGAKTPKRSPAAHI